MFAVERLSVTRTAPRCLDVSLWDLFGMKSGTRREKVKHYRRSPYKVSITLLYASHLYFVVFL